LLENKFLSFLRQPFVDKCWFLEIQVIPGQVILFVFQKLKRQLFFPAAINYAQVWLLLPHCGIHSTALQRIGFLALRENIE